MKIRYILPNDRPETIEKHKELLLKANPDCEFDGLNINPLKKNEQREGEFEVDLVLKHKDEKAIDEKILKATENAQKLIEQLEIDKATLSRELNELKGSNKNVQN